MPFASQTDPLQPMRRFRGVGLAGKSKMKTIHSFWAANETKTKRSQVHCQTLLREPISLLGSLVVKVRSSFTRTCTSNISSQTSKHALPPTPPSPTKLQNMPYLQHLHLQPKQTQMPSAFQRVLSRFDRSAYHSTRLRPPCGGSVCFLWL